MKTQKGITLVTLVITIIVLIILAGISINTLVGKDGIITKAQQAKENTILAQEEEEKQLNQLYYELENAGKITESGDEIILNDFMEFKKKIAEAITEKGVNTLATDTADIMSENIRKIASFEGNKLTPIVSNGLGATSCSVTVPSGTKRGYVIACANAFYLPTLSISGAGIESQTEIASWKAQQGNAAANHIVKIFYCTFKEGETITASMSASGNNYATSLMIFQEEEMLKPVISNGAGATSCSVTVPTGTKEGYVISCANAFFLPDLYITGKGVERQKEVATFKAQQGNSAANHIVKIFYCTFNEEADITAKMYASGNNYATSLMILN